MASAIRLQQSAKLLEMGLMCALAWLVGWVGGWCGVYVPVRVKTANAEMSILHTRIQLTILQLRRDTAMYLAQILDQELGQKPKIYQTTRM